MIVSETTDTREPSCAHFALRSERVCRRDREPEIREEETRVPANMAQPAAPATSSRRPRGMRSTPFEDLFAEDVGELKRRCG